MRWKRSGVAHRRLLTLGPVVCVLGAVVCVALAASAQRTQTQPATDSSVQSSPIQSVPPAPVTDSSQEASPIGHQHTGPAVSIAPHTAIPIRLSRSIDSGHLKNGQNIAGTLAAPLALSPRGTLPAGTAVEVNVVETLAAGKLYSAGEFSLQLVRVGSLAVYANTLTYRGNKGHKDLPDSAPATGTDAGLPAGAAITFHVLPPPSAASGPPRNSRVQPGAVNGVAPGAAPPPGSSKPAGTPGAPKGTIKSNGTPLKPITPADNSPQPAQDLDKSSPEPNQPSAPANTSPTDSSKPHP